MKKARQILALCGILFLVAMYVCTLVFALIDDPRTFTLLRGAIGATIIIPVMLWVILIFLKIAKPTDLPSSSDDADDNSRHDEM